MTYSYQSGDVLVIVVPPDYSLDKGLPVKVILKDGELLFIPFLIENAIPIPEVVLNYFDIVHAGKASEEYCKRIEDHIGDKTYGNSVKWEIVSDVWRETAEYLPEIG